MHILLPALAAHTTRLPQAIVAYLSQPWYFAPKPIQELQVEHPFSWLLATKPNRSCIYSLVGDLRLILKPCLLQLACKWEPMINDIIKSREKDVFFGIFHLRSHCTANLLRNLTSSIFCHHWRSYQDIFSWKECSNKRPVYFLSLLVLQVHLQLHNFPCSSTKVNHIRIWSEKHK